MLSFQLYKMLFSISSPPNYLYLNIHNYSDDNPRNSSNYNEQMVRKQNIIEYPHNRNGCLFYSIFLLLLEMGTTVVSYLRYCDYDKRCS